MKNACGKYMYKLGIAVVQAPHKSTLSTPADLNRPARLISSAALPAGCTHKIVLFAQAIEPVFDHIARALSPLSTKPNTNTN